MTIANSALERNKYGVFNDLGTVTIDKTIIADSTSRGMWFNLPNLNPLPPASVITASDITSNATYGIFIGTQSDYPLASMPYGSGNNIFGNNAGGVQLTVNSFPNFKNADVNWRGNYWGEDTYYYTNPAECTTVSPSAVGRLAYHSSTTNPPAGPLGGGTYAISHPYPQPSTTCAYGPFELSDCAFSSSYISNGRQVVAYPGEGVSVGDAVGCAGEMTATIEKLECDYPGLDPNLVAQFAPPDDMSNDDIVAAYEPELATLFDDLAGSGEFSYAYPGTACVHRMTLSPDASSSPSGTFPAAPCDNPWWPVEGRVTVGQSALPGRRYVRQRFRWDLANLLYFKACRGNLTVEPDAVFDSSDGTYLGTKIGAKLSNLPRHYDDTRLLDNEGEATYTVGSGDAQQLLAGVEYYTLIRTLPGSANTDRMFVRFQNGVRVPQWCYSTYCIFSAETFAEEVVIGKWVTVPNSYPWTH